MIDAAVFTAAGILLLFAAHRLAVARTGRVQRCMYVFALCLGFSLVLNTPGMLLAPGGAALLIVVVHGLKLAALTCVALIADALGRRAAARHAPLLLGVAVQAASALCFVLAHVTVTTDSLVVRPGREGFFAVYGALFAMYGAWCAAGLVPVLAGHRRASPPGAIRTGLLLLTAAAAVGTAWTSWALADAIEVLRRGRVGLGEDLVSTLLGVTVAVLAASGASAAFWPRALAAPRRWLGARRAYRALEPLWGALHRELPGIALDMTPAGGHGPGPWRASYALYRRVIEIRDAYLALRPYMPSAPSGHGAGIAVIGATPAAREAAAIAAALENRRDDVRPGPARPATTDAGPDAELLVRTLEDETVWLVEVARAYAGRTVRPAAEPRVPGAVTPAAGPPTSRPPGRS
ncbi:MAB_1171c family putative transporter [Streptomyces sp. NPDC090306]|uniref:MAB_1171c family putative transporter n=1 Tax=Streptomyces sp. NPDC090306 TaxID=3365961 RepID=UPI003817CD50